MKFSILTPSFNQARFLERHIQSVLNQGVEGTQHIIYDGGSTDETPAILQRYSDRLFFWASENDRGQGDALNKALAKASNEIIGWLNTDEFYEPHVFEIVRDIFERDPKVMVVYGNHRQYTPAEELIRTSRTWRFDYEICRMQTPIMVSAATFLRRDRLLEVGGFDPRWQCIMDWDVFIRYMKDNQKWVRLRRVLANATMHPLSKTARLPEVFLEEIYARRHIEFPGLTRAQIEELRKKQLHRMIWHLFLDGLLPDKMWFKMVRQRNFEVYFGIADYYPVLTPFLNFVSPRRPRA